MHAPQTVRLIAHGVSVDVPRDVGFDLLDRDRRLLTAGLTEQAALVVDEQRRATLHLLLGVGHLALIEAPEPAPPDEEEPIATRPSADSAAAAASFIDFDAYVPAPHRSTSGGVERVVPGGLGE